MAADPPLSFDLIISYNSFSKVIKLMSIKENNVCSIKTSLEAVKL